MKPSLLLKLNQNFLRLIKKVSPKNIVQSLDISQDDKISKERDPNTLLMKLRYLPKVLSSKEQKVLGVFTLFFIISSIWLLSSLWYSVTVEIPKQGGTYTEGVVGRPRTINPLYASTNSADRDLVKLTYSGLIRFDGEKLIPDLAEEWTISPDQKEYTFKLRQNIKWTDGNEFTSNDVAFTIETIKDRSYQSSLRGKFANVKTEILDEHTVKFTLPEPLTPFLEDLTVGILPAHIWQHVRPENILLTEFNIQPVGLGPYKFKKLIKDQFGAIRSYLLVRNPDFHLGEPNIKEIELRFYSDEQAALNALNQNEIESINFLAYGKQPIIETNNIRLLGLQLPQYTAIFFNLSSDKAIGNKNVRKALAHTIDKDEIVREAIKDKGRVIHGPILPGYPGYHPDIEKFELNTDISNELLNEAEWTLVDGKRQKGDETLEITLTTADRPELIKSANLIQEAWSKLGIEVKLSIVGINEIQEHIISSRDFEVLLFGEIVGLDPDPYPFWHSSQISNEGLNISNFKHSEANQVLEEARQTPDQETKNEKYIHFQNILVAELPAIFLYNPDYIYPISYKIKGADQKLIINPSDRLTNIHKWFIKTKRVLKR